jgi:chloride channel 7
MQQLLNHNDVLRAPPGVFLPPSAWAWIDPGVFALIGAGAFMGGVTRLTVALAVIMMEVCACHLHDAKSMHPLTHHCELQLAAVKRASHTMYWHMVNVPHNPYRQHHVLADE